MIYVLILFFFFIFTYRYDYCKRRKGRAFAYWGMFIVFVLLAGLRYRLGIDSVRYESSYEEFPTFFELSRYNFSGTRYEPGFVIVGSIMRTFSPDFTYFQLFEALIVNGTVWWFASKYAKNKFLFLALYYVFLYFALNFQVMREALAVCIFLWSWPLIKSGKWLWYYCVAFINLFFHTSSIFMLILPLFFAPGIRTFFRFGNRTFIISLAIIVVLLILQKVFFQFFQLIAISDRIVDRARIYADDINGGARLNFLGMFSVFFRNVLYPMLALAFTYHNYKIMKRRERQRIQRPERWKYDVMVVVGIYVAAASVVIFIFMRYLNYFGFFTMLAISNVVFDKYLTMEKKIKIRPVYWYLALLPLFAYQIYTYWSPVVPSGNIKVYNQFYPYSSRLDPVEDQQREKYYRYERVW